MVVDNKATVSYIRVLKEDLAIFRITPADGPVPDFKAGQFVTLGLHIPSEGKIIRRAYSIASPPEQKKHFELIIRWVRKPVPGRLTTELFNKKEGDEIMWVKPTGIFTINEKLHNGERDNGRDKWDFYYRASISRPQEWFNRSWGGQRGRVETFLRPKAGSDRSPLEELVGEKVTTENTSFYVCGWQGTVDGSLDYLVPKGFVTERNKRKDGSYEVKFESYG